MLALTDRLLEGLRAAGLQVATPAASHTERSAILSFTTGSEAANQGLFERLADRDIVIALRGGHCRVSPSFMTTEGEIDRLLEALSEGFSPRSAAPCL